MNSKSQSSIEFISNYSIVLIIILILIFFIWQSGILKPPVPRGKTGFFGVVPVDWSVSARNNSLYLTLRNDLDESIALKEIDAKIGNVKCNNVTTNLKLRSGEIYITNLTCNISKKYIEGEYYKADIEILYNTSTGFEHSSVGEVHGPIEVAVIVTTTITCTPDGCNGNCPPGCTVNEDPDCGCLDNDGCCGIGCDFTNDNDCPTVTLSCTIRNTPCIGNEVCVFRMDDTAGGHAGTCSDSSYSYRVCCSASSGSLSVDIKDGNCGQDGVISLFSTDNSHVEKYPSSNYNNDICLSSTAGVINCNYPASCGGGHTCIASISDTTNAHIGDCNAYTTKICCWII